MYIELTREESLAVSGLLGQMSDGLWENNRRYEKYWRNMRLSGTVLVIDGFRIAWNLGESEKAEREMWLSGDERSVRRWLVRKCRLVQKAECRYGSKDSFLIRGMSAFEAAQVVEGMGE